MVPRREHTARLHIQSEVEDRSLQRIAGEFAPGIDATVGKLRATGATAVVLIHFDAARFTVEGVRAWLRAKAFRPIEFVPALSGPEAYEGNASANLMLMARVDIHVATEPGRPTTFTLTAYAGGALRVAGWPEAVAIDLAALNLPGFLPVLGAAGDQHGLRAGRCEPQVLHNELLISGTLSPVTEAGRQLIERAMHGEEIRASVVVTAQKNEGVAAEGFAVVNGREMTGPMIVVRRGDLREIALSAERASAGASAFEAQAAGAGENPAAAIAEPLSDEEAAQAGLIAPPQLPSDLPGPAGAAESADANGILDLQPETVGEGPGLIPVDAEAGEVLAAWSNLSAAVRQQILDMIRKSGTS